jgi:hypothetical protein
MIEALMIVTLGHDPQGGDPSATILADRRGGPRPVCRVQNSEDDHHRSRDVTVY